MISVGHMRAALPLNEWILGFFCVPQVQYRVVEDYNGAFCPLRKGFNTFLRTPCTEEPRINLTKGETIFATRGTKCVITLLQILYLTTLNDLMTYVIFFCVSRWWMYGDKVLDEEQTKGRQYLPALQ